MRVISYPCVNSRFHNHASRPRRDRLAARADALGQLGGKVGDGRAAGL